VAASGKPLRALPSSSRSGGSEEQRNFDHRLPISPTATGCGGVKAGEDVRCESVLADHGFVTKHRAGKHNYYINPALVRLFLDVSGER